MAVGAGDHQVEFLSERHQLGLLRPPGLPRLAVPGGGEERTPNPAMGSLREHLAHRRLRRAHDDQVGFALGHLVDRREGRPAEHLGPLAVGGEHGPLVATGEQVVQGDEPELARVGRRPGDDDPLRVEQRIEAVDAGATTRCPWFDRFAATDRGVARRRVPELDQRVDGHGPTIADDQWVEVDRGDIAALDRQAAQRAQQVDEHLPVDRRLAAKRSEHLLGGQPVDQRRGVGPVERCGGEDDVADRLGEHAAQAEGHQRPKLLVAEHTGDQLAVPGDHRGDEQLDLAVFATGQPEQVDGGGLDGRARGQAQPNQAAFGLVGDRVTGELQHHRVTQRVGRSGRRWGILGRRLAGHRYSVSGHQGLAVGLGQRAGDRYRGVGHGVTP